MDLTQAFDWVSTLPLGTPYLSITAPQNHTCMWNEGAIFIPESYLLNLNRNDFTQS